VSAADISAVILHCILHRSAGGLPTCIQAQASSHLCPESLSDEVFITVADQPVAWWWMAGSVCDYDEAKAVQA